MKTIFRLMIPAVLVSLSTGCQEMRLNRDVLYQASSISALMGGVYDGDTSVAQLQFHGDLGIGTFNALDGEMIACNGVYYRITADGMAHPLSEEEAPNALTPFATVTFFDSDQSVAVHGLADYSQLQRHVDNFIANPNAFYAIKIDGLFRYVQVRSVPRQSPPYRPLTSVAAEQPLHEFHNQPGTIVGFRLPEYMRGVNVPGYHLHFITADRRQGGHVLDCQMEAVDVELDYTAELHMVLPGTDSFSATPFGPASPAQMKAVESR